MVHALLGGVRKYLRVFDPAAIISRKMGPWYWKYSGPSSRQVGFARLVFMVVLRGFAVPSHCSWLFVSGTLRFSARDHEGVTTDYRNHQLFR